MSSINARGYMRVRTGLFTNTISFGRQDETVPIGESLLQFVYSDINALLNRASYVKEDFINVHPYFQYCDPQWLDGFLHNLVSHEMDSAYLRIEDMQSLQSRYSALLADLYSSSSEFNTKKVEKILSDSEFIRDASCYNQCSLQAGSDERCFIDFFVSSFEETLYIELLEMIRRKISLSTCKNCGKLFIPKRSNSDYCQRVYTPDGKTCAEIGYVRSFNQSVKNDELLMAYTKAYKAHYARMSKPRKRVRNMTREEFQAWYREAKDKLGQARAGLIDAEEYKQWLKK